MAAKLKLMLEVTDETTGADLLALAKKVNDRDKVFIKDNAIVVEFGEGIRPGEINYSGPFPR